MKVQFRSRKAEQPERDRGMKVLYGPSRRTGYRLRWYLILLLVAVPIVYLAYSLGSLVFIRHLPGQVTLQHQILRAPVDGVVDQVSVSAGERVAPGDLLIKLRQTPIQHRLGEVEAELQAVALTMEGLQSDHERLEDHWSEEVATLRRQLQVTEDLRQEGAATGGEVKAARAELVARERQRSRDLMDGASSLRGLDARRRTLLAEKRQLTRRLESLELRARESGRAEAPAVAPGELVLQGETLVRLFMDRDYRLLLYVAPRYGDRLEAGTKLELVFPDDGRYLARVQGTPGTATRPPQGMTGPLSADTRMLEIQMRLERPLESRHVVDGLKFTAEVPSAIPWLR